MVSMLLFLLWSRGVEPFNGKKKRASEPVSRGLFFPLRVVGAYIAQVGSRGLSGPKLSGSEKWKSVQGMQRGQRGTKTPRIFMETQLEAHSREKER